MINRIILFGRICADPELKYTQTGVAVTNFTLAVERPFKVNDQKITDFIPCVAWRKTAEVICQYSGKGKMLGVVGSLQMRKYQTKEGENRTVYEVIVDEVQLLEFSNKSSTGDTQSAPPSDYTPPPQNNGNEELPF